MSSDSESNVAYSSLVYLQFEPEKCSCTTSNPLFVFQLLFSTSPPSWPQEEQLSSPARSFLRSLQLSSSPCPYPLLTALFFSPLLILCIPKQTIQVMRPLKRSLRTSAASPHCWQSLGTQRYTFWSIPFGGWPHTRGKSRLNWSILWTLGVRSTCTLEYSWCPSSRHGTLHSLSGRLPQGWEAARTALATEQ